MFIKNLNIGYIILSFISLNISCSSEPLHQIADKYLILKFATEFNPLLLHLYGVFYTCVNSTHEIISYYQ